VALTACLVSAAATLTGGAAPALAASPEAPDVAPSASAPYVPGEVLVRYRDGTSASERAQARSEQAATLERKLPLKNTELLKLEPGDSVRETAKDLEDQSDVVYAQPNFIRTADSVTPNDPSFGQLWGLDNQGQAINGVSGLADADIDAPEAWGATTGNPNVTVAVVDTGVDSSRPDLAPNLWTNPGETGTDSHGDDKKSNGVDDDSDGKVDDWQGWDFVFGDTVPNDPNGHGTHVSGTIGARGNDGTGVAGVTWSSKIMPVRVLGSNGSGNDANVAAGFVFAAQHGAKVVNASLGGDGDPTVLAAAIAQSPNTLFVVAAGNSSADVDTSPEYPCAIPAPNVVCVAATTQTDGLASFSNYGSQGVDLAAPGVRVLSTCPPGASGIQCPSSGFKYLSGTSMATPHVSGVAALVDADQPGASVAQVKETLLDSVDYLPSLDGRTVTGGRVNAARALGLLPPSIKSSPPGGGSPPAPAPAPAGDSASPPSADPVTQIGFTLAKKVTNHSNGDAVLVVNVQGAGLVWAKATARLPAHKPSSDETAELRITTLTVPVSKAGAVKLRITTPRRAKTVLKKKGRLKAKVKVSYRRSNGSVQSQTRTITLKYSRKR
jgi:subtilisin family serine protease